MKVAMLAKGMESLRHCAFLVHGEAPFNYSLEEQHKSIVVVCVQNNRVLQLITAYFGRKLQACTPSCVNYL